VRRSTFSVSAFHHKQFFYVVSIALALELPDGCLG
jgi:hypothetical protein